MHRGDATRDAEIRALQLLDEPLPDVLTHLVRAAARAVGVSGAQLNVIGHELQHSLVDAFGPPSARPARESFCARIVEEDAPLHVVPDARLDRRFAGYDVVRSGEVRFYAAHQLVTSAGTAIGTLCVFDPASRNLDHATQDLLSELAAAIVEILESRRQGEELAASINQLIAGSRELRRSNEHLAAFAGQVSHDVQGPLASVLMALQLMREDLGATGGTGADLEREGRILDAALAGAERMRDTVTGLMDFALLGGRITPSRVAMGTVVDEVLMDLGLPARRAVVEYDDLPSVCGDPVMVRVMTQNLVANAVKYAGEHARIRIEGSLRPGWTRITVLDNGPGVPLADRERIFEPHARGEGEAVRAVEGLGIGLGTCRRIAEAHGGALGVHDAPGGGAAFWFELPDAD